MAELGSTHDPMALVPGSSGVVDGIVQAWEKNAVTVGATYDALRSLRAPDQWVGTAADAFGVYMSNVTKDTQRFHQSFVDAATALTSYGETLRWAQAKAATAIELWESATATLRAIGSTVLSATLPADDQAAASVAREQRTAAQDMLTDARQQLAAAGATAAQHIRAAIVTVPVRRTATMTTVMSASTATAPAPGFLEILLISARGPKATYDWWTALTEAEQEDLINTYPGFIGNLEGVDYTSRSKANEKYLDQQISEARDIRDNGMTPAERLRAGLRLNALEGIYNALHPTYDSKTKASFPMQLIRLSSDVPPLAAIAIGNMDDATNITYVVPGMDTSTDGNGMSDWMGPSVNLRLEQDQVSGYPARNVVVAWMAYNTPKTPLEEASLSKARDGGDLLRNALQGTSATNADARLNIAALSYGGSTSAQALASGTVHVDSLVMLAPPGVSSAIDEASDLRADHVYVGENDDDWRIGNYATYGEDRTDVTTTKFGAIDLGTDGGGGLAGVTKHGAAPTPPDVGYFTTSSESLRNTAYATTGQGNRVSHDR